MIIQCYFIVIFSMFLACIDCKALPQKPFNLKQSLESCWMASSIQCLYRCDSVREKVQEIALMPYNAGWSSSKKDAWNFLKKLYDVFEKMKITEYFEITELYNVAFDVSKSFLDEYSKEADNFLKSIDQDSDLALVSWLKTLKLFNATKFFEDTSNKFENGSPTYFLVLLVSALSRFTDRFPQIVDVCDLDPSDPDGIIHRLEIAYDNNKEARIITSMSECMPESISINTLGFELIGAIIYYNAKKDMRDKLKNTMSKAEFDKLTPLDYMLDIKHFCVLVKYDKWILFDPLTSDKILPLDGTLKEIKDRGNPLIKDLDDSSKQLAWEPEVLFYQQSESGIQEKLFKLKEQLTALKQKLAHLKLRFEELKARLET